MTRNGSLSPYEVIGGGAWLALPACVQALHGPGSARGRLDVTLGAHPVASWIARWMKLPRTGANTPVTLSVSRQRDHLVWRRWFGDTQLITDQHAHNGLLVERFGLLELRFRLVITTTGFDCVQQHASLALGRLRVPIPTVLAPVAHAVVRGMVDGVAIAVGVGVPWIGPLLTYRGVMHAEELTS